jgi:hypothetical protein
MRREVRPTEEIVQMLVELDGVDLFRSIEEERFQRKIEQQRLVGWFFITVLLIGVLTTVLFVGPPDTKDKALTALIAVLTGASGYGLGRAHQAGTGGSAALHSPRSKALRSHHDEPGTTQSPER